MDRPSTGVLMFIAQRHVEMRVMEAVAALGYDDLTLAQARLGARIGDEGTRATELAEAGQVTKQTAGYLVCFTERGRELQRAAREVERRVEQEWADHLGPERLETLRELLTELREITDPWWEGPRAPELSGAERG
jgi:prophage DNA circulation protein